jgi:MFS transporter, DHA2 family, multidrug resistance protein
MDAAVDRRTVGTRRWWAPGALTMAVLAVGLGGTILSVAIPTLARTLHASEPNLQRFSSSYADQPANPKTPIPATG